MDHRPFRTTRRLTNLSQGRPSWYRIQAKANGAARIDIYDEIGFMAVSAQDFSRDLSEITGDIELHLNSPGGDVFDAIAIFSQLKQRPGNVAVVVDGLAASAASFIAQAASPGLLAMAPHSQMMIHDGFGLAIGNAADMRDMADLLDRASDNIAGIYASRSGVPASVWRDAMRTETWYSDQEAVDARLADTILGQEPVTNSWDLSVFQNSSADESGWDASRAWANGAAADNPEAFYRGICAGHHGSGDPATQAHWALPHHYHPGDPPNAAGVRNALARLPQTHDLADEAGARAHLNAHMASINPTALADPGLQFDTSIAELLRSEFAPKGARR